MPIPSTGSISLNQINTEFGRGNNLNAYRGTTYFTPNSGTPQTFPAGAISFSNFYGTQVSAPTATVEFVVIAGGGGGTQDAGGGGAGGYRASVGPSGGGAGAQPHLSFTLGTAYTVTVGAGGAAVQDYVVAGNRGSNSTLSSVSSWGGGSSGGNSNPLNGGQPGGSGGGGGYSTNGAAGSPGQGYAGGNGDTSAFGGGGGAGGNGSGSNPAAGGGPGGAGVASSITGTSVTRGGGGGGGAYSNGLTGGSGGPGGGGTGAGGWTVGGSGTNGGTNTGGGAGGARYPFTTGAGGSGVVILRVPTARTASFSPGVTQSPSVSGGYNIYTVTATSTTSQTVTIN